MRVKLLYFASLADRAGRAEEVLDTSARAPRDLYAEIAAQHGFAFSTDRIRVDANGTLLVDRKSTRLNSSHAITSRMPSSA